MRNLRIACLIWVIACITCNGRAQQASVEPHVGYAYPAGGCTGTTLEITIGGQNIQGATKAFITGTGVLATVKSYDKPLTQRQIVAIRDKLDEARKKLQLEPGVLQARPGQGVAFLRIAREAGISDADLKKFLEFAKNRNDPKKQLNPQISETVTLQVTIDTNAPPGDRELRLLTAVGLTNPLRFCVGSVPEILENEPNDGSPDKIDSLPVVVNGQIMPGDVDSYTFVARKGMRLVVTARARDVMPYLADTVPGWFQAALRLTDEQNLEIAYADHYEFQPDPVLLVQIPADGSYTLEVRDTLYRGREDFVYRVTIGEQPFITSVIPMGFTSGKNTQIGIKGWNLPENRLQIEPNAGANSIQVTVGALRSNSMLFAGDALPEIAEKAPTNSKLAQKVTIPCIINDRIGKPGEVDSYAFVERAGQTVVAEVDARRLGSPLDSTLTLIDPKGRMLAANDDTPDKGAGLLTHQADSYLSCKLLVSGLYTLTIGDAQHNGGDEYGYRLRVSQPMPDFALRVTPSSLNVRAGMTVPITVYALRRDGFTGDIALELVGTPPGFRLSGGWIPAGKDEAHATLTVSPLRRNEPVELHMEGVATINGKKIRRSAVPADDMMQAFAYHHLVPAQMWLVSVIGRGALGPGMRLTDQAPVKIPSGGTAQIEMLGVGAAQVKQLKFSVSEPAEGFEIVNVSADENGAIIQIKTDGTKIKPGLKGNLLIGAYLEIGPTKRKVPVTTLPAVPFEIIKP